MVHRRWLVIPEMLEACHVGVADQEWHVGVTVVYCTELSSVEVCLQVVLHDWSLYVSSVLGTGGLTIDAISECEDVIESLVLESVWAHINHTILSCNTCINKLLVWETGWVHVHMGEWMLLNLTGVDMLESTDFFSDGVLLDLQ